MTVRTSLVLVAFGFAGALAAQTTGPSFNAPYRAFASHEFGATMAFPRGGGTQIEGQYRFGSGTFDVGMRGGIYFPGGVRDEEFVVGVEGRNRVLTHSETFPLDGALVFGAGARVNGGTFWQFPVGLSLGRRLTIEGSDISIIPYVQPTGFLTASSGDTDFLFALGLGADFRLSSVFDARLSIGLGDMEGLAISAVWVR
jgi:hypothetical protein